MHVNATIPAISFVTLMVVCVLVCYAVAVARGDIQAWIPYIRYVLYMVRQNCCNCNLCHRLYIYVVQMLVLS